MHPVIDRRGRRRHHGGMLIIDLSHIRPGARVILTPRRLRAAERRALANRAAQSCAGGKAGRGQNVAHADEPKR